MKNEDISNEKISNEDIDDTIKVVESIGKSGLLIDGANEDTGSRKQQGELHFAMMEPVAASLIEPRASSLINALTGKGAMRVEKEQEGGFFILLPLSLMIKLLGKRITRAGRKYSKMDHVEII